jgi:hypothetical protein
LDEMKCSSFSSGIKEQLETLFSSSSHPLASAELVKK